MRPCSSNLLKCSSKFSLRPTALLLCKSTVIALALELLSIARATAAGITHYFTINPVKVCNPYFATCAPTPMYEAETYKIFSQAGIAPIFLPVTPLYNFDLSLLSVTGVEEIDLPKNKRHPNPTTINAWFVNSIVDPADPSNLIFGEAWPDRNGLVINGPAVLNEGINGRRDTFAHELGHNFGLYHYDTGDYGLDGNNLMADGSIRRIPSVIGDITPDGASLSQLTSAQIDTILRSHLLNPATIVNVGVQYNSAPFHVSITGGRDEVFLKSLTFYLSSEDEAKRDLTVPIGSTSSNYPFFFDDLIGINEGEIGSTGSFEIGPDGYQRQRLQLTFSDGAFKSGDSFRFGFRGFDDPNRYELSLLGSSVRSVIGSFFVEPFEYEFSDGYIVRSALRDDMTISSLFPSQPPVLLDTNSVVFPHPPRTPT